MVYDQLTVKYCEKHYMNECESIWYAVFFTGRLCVIFRYENCKKILQCQLAKNEQSITDVPSESVSLKGLHTRLQEIQVSHCDKYNLLF